MDSTDRLIQARLDGALGPAEARAVEHALAADPAKAASAHDLERLDGLLRVALPRRDDLGHLARVIAERTPHTVPVCEVRLRPVDALAAALVAGFVIGSCWWLDRVVHVAALLAGLSLGVLVIGLALVSLTLIARQGGPLQLLRTGWSLGPGPALICRTAGFALVLGAMWMAW